MERKVKPVTEPYEYKKQIPLDHEKSKLSLSQIYEQEYLKQTQVSLIILPCKAQQLWCTENKLHSSNQQAVSEFWETG